MDRDIWLDILEFADTYESLLALDRVDMGAEVGPFTIVTFVLTFNGALVGGRSSNRLCRAFG
jgi:hypothetical protein